MNENKRGSNSGSDPAYAAQARALGDRLAADGISLIFGGGNVGLMGIVADAVLAGVTQLAISVENKDGVPEQVGPRLPYLFQGWLVKKSI